ncbi:Zinc finger RING/FYVE/PHD-type [Penicillium bovifimosum]|uniref:Zinc finger RING/FYVE/PHD-type n=1 Tax=Penicillium bovifimosum TaxID=126998 RepID=A0A9W9KUH6_9EURO|nr:Zinc finger RING/FYVE/PHD-type [Penicillium bovifimosum]KAJ5120427.1 Zinc finger RING/FYVE/PHD-type [Penicillium bovifimosum]
MGNDGGSIPTRRELVREAARAPSTAQVKETQREQQEHCWTTCPLSHKSLVRPIVSDSVGNLYNKDAILQFLLPGDDVEGISSKADCEEILCGRVKSLRDVVEMKFEVDTELTEHPSGRAFAPRERREGWICPITAKALGPSVKSVYLVPCGHVFSEEAIRQLKGDKCLQCNESYTEDNIIPILTTKKEDKQRLIARGHKLAEQGLTHSLKKAPGSKKRKKQASAEGAADAAEPAGSDPSKEPSDSKGRSNTSTPVPANAASNGIKNAATSSLTARVLAEEEEKKKRRKLMGRNENIDSLFSKKDGGSKNRDFMTRGFSIS